MTEKNSKAPVKNIAGKVRELIEDKVLQLGYFLWDVEYVKEGAEWYLRITIDSENGISIDDCEKVHREIDPMLDEADPIENSYRLEVCSPGIERELKNEEHYSACKGEKVSLKLYTAFEGKKTYEGILEGYDTEKKSFLINENSNEFEIEKNLVSKIRTVYDFS